MTRPLAGAAAGGSQSAVSGPFLKWAGGKAKLAPLIACRSPRDFPRYHEPFVGAGAVFFSVAERQATMPARLNDLNGALMETFQVVRDDVGPLIDTLHRMALAFLPLDDTGRRDYFYATRADEPRDAVARAARFIFLNRTGYNGLYRVNRAGKFNVPYGRYANPRILHAVGLVAASKALQRAELTSVDFATACDAATAGDFVYLDPPYQPLSATSNFTSYTSQAFGPDEQRRLRDVFDALTDRGVAAMLSNSSHPVIEELYAGRGYGMETVRMSRAINSNGQGRSAIAELLIDNLERVGARRSGEFETEVEA